MCSVHAQAPQANSVVWLRCSGLTCQMSSKDYPCSSLILRQRKSQRIDCCRACIGYRHVCVSQTLQVMADRRNKIALPALATKYGFRLPPPEDCLIAPIFQFHPRNAPENMEWEDDPIPAGNALIGNLCIFKGNSIQSSACQFGLSATVVTSSCCGMFK